MPKNRMATVSDRKSGCGFRNASLECFSSNVPVLTMFFSEIAMGKQQDEDSAHGTGPHGTVQ